MLFFFLLSGDKQCSGDVKAIEKGRNLVENRRIQAVSFMFNGNEIFLSGIVGASVKNKVTCSTKKPKYCYNIIINYVNHLKNQNINLVDNAFCKQDL